MIKAGAIGAVIGFIYIMSLSLLSPICTLCFTPLLGLGVGYLAGWFEKLADVRASLSRGTIAGGITGLGVVVGQMMATVVNGILVTNSDRIPALMNEVGLSQFVITNNDEYWQSILVFNSFCSLFNLALVAGLGAVGGMIWFQRHQATLLPGVSS
jgi:hypothetical protein